MKKRRKRRSPTEPELVRRDGALCAALVNTAGRRRRPRTAGPFSTYADFLAWCQEAGLIDAAAAERLARAAAERPVDAAIAIHKALDRLALAERILHALADHEEPDPDDVEAVNAELARSVRRLVRSGGGYHRARTDPGGSELERPLWPIVVSIADVLGSKYQRRVRRCGGEGCDLLFVDRSPGKPRKWCSRKSCGDRMRSGRRYHATIKPLLEDDRRRRRQGLPSAFDPSPPQASPS